ncbi:MAG TPA: glycosyltransferase family 9 protein [Gemmatimonadaceae bacterium]|nr:glycosyltransferase family 9 protein [Gemmatimonadaceae bacterium]
MRLKQGSYEPKRETSDADARRILVIELWNIGDIVLTMPFLAQLRARFPLASVTLLARPLAAEILAGTGLIDDIIAADLTWTRGNGLQLSSKTIGFVRALKRVRAGRFDVAFSARPHRRERLLLALSGARRTLGLRAEEHGARNSHKVQDWMRLLEPFGLSPDAVPTPRLFITDGERVWARSYLSSRGVLQKDLLIGIHPGASLPQKRWPLAGFRDVAVALSAQPGTRTLAFAEPTGYGMELFDLPEIVPARVSLREMIALTAECDLMVCNDSGPMHIAAALGVPTVAMFGARIDRWFAPLGDNHEILRPESIAVERGISSPVGIDTAAVIDAVGRTLRRLRGSDTFTDA